MRKTRLTMAAMAAVCVAMALACTKDNETATDPVSTTPDGARLAVFVTDFYELHSHASYGEVSTCWFTWDSTGRLQQVKEDDIVYALEYDGDRLLKVRPSNDSEWGYDYTYNGNQLASIKTIENGREIGIKKFTYNSDGQIASLTTEEGVTWELTWKNGNVVHADISGDAELSDHERHWAITYDNAPSPWIGLEAFWLARTGDIFALSANSMTGCRDGSGEDFHYINRYENNRVVYSEQVSSEYYQYTDGTGAGSMPQVCTISVNGNEQGRYLAGQTVRIQAAEEQDGKPFVRWSNGATANPYTFTASQDITLTAIYEENN